MKRNLLLVAVLMVLLLTANATGARADVVTNPAALTGLLNRIGGEGTAAHFSIVIDPELSTDGKDVFVITSDGELPCIKANNVNAGAAGINWYLNHYAHVNLSWSELTTDLSAVDFPLPATEEKHTSSAQYRYNLNYCTFSYTCAFWTWERWQQEIDWMALHGINLPLQLVGADVVWLKTLLDLGYTKDEANAFIAGPGFQAWWLMDNLEGHGGANPDWWYTRQEELAKKILERERELGMNPVLPGYAGMVPFNIKSKKPSWSFIDTGIWAGGFQRPGFLDPTQQAEAFAEISASYYSHLNSLMGQSDFYSMDPFHEGGGSGSADLLHAYTGLFAPIKAINPNAKWVIQNWGSNPLSQCFNTMSKGSLLVLNLFADAWGYKNYSGHDNIFCMLHNFGGRTGLHGRLESMAKNYLAATSNSAQKGIGATMEGGGTNPILYDALFELPWITSFDMESWLADYAVARYSQSGYNSDTHKAWKALAGSVYACKSSSQQGTSEPIICARPSLTANNVSSWSTSEVYYDPAAVRYAAAKLLAAKSEANNATNYSHDVTDFVRQAITDDAYFLLKRVNSTKGTSQFNTYSQRFLSLMLDMDTLLNTNTNFMVGPWLEGAKAITDEAEGTTAADKSWMEWNARMLISTWTTNNTNLHDYSNREWGGMIKDYYYPRWEALFKSVKNSTSTPNYFNMETAWRGGATTTYTTTYPVTPQGDSYDVAQKLFNKYFGQLTLSSDTLYYYSYSVVEDKTVTDADKKIAPITDEALRGADYTFSFTTPVVQSKSTVFIDWNNDGEYSEGEKYVIPAGATSRIATISVPATAITGNHTLILALDDATGEPSIDVTTTVNGTTLSYVLLVKDVITEARTVSVSASDAALGSVKIIGNAGLSVTTINPVTVSATAGSKAEFSRWLTADGTLVSRENPYTYYGKESIELSAAFVKNLWTKPVENTADMGTIESYGQYLTNLCIIQNDITKTLYTTNSMIPQLNIDVPKAINAPAGTHFTIKWNDSSSNGLVYCNLSAYIDLNADGDFLDAGELLEARGNKSASNNTTVADGQLAVALPETMSLGETRIRFRFDSAWQTFSADGSMPADATTTRPVYDMVLNITSLPEDTTTITVKSENTLYGTAEVSGIGSEAFVAPGVQIILQALPASGYSFLNWVDKYGKVVGTLTDQPIIPMENNTYTAKFQVAETSVNNVTVEQSPEAIYDLQGRNVTNEASSLKGVFIKRSANDAEKVVIK